METLESEPEDKIRKENNKVENKNTDDDDQNDDNNDDDDADVDESQSTENEGTKNWVTTTTRSGRASRIRIRYRNENGGTTLVLGSVGFYQIMVEGANELEGYPMIKKKCAWEQDLVDAIIIILIYMLRNSNRNEE